MSGFFSRRSWPCRFAVLRCARLAWLIAASISGLAAGSALAAAGDPVDLARDFLGRGAQAFRLGDVVQATRDWSEAIQLCRIAGARDLETEALQRRGEALATMGNLRQALEDLAAAHRTAGSLGEPRRIAIAAGALGNARLLARDPSGARPLLEQSLELARRNSLLDVLAASSNNLGNLLVSEGRENEATAAYAESAESARRIGDPSLAATALTNEARVLARAAGTAPSVDALLEEAMALLRPLEPERAVIFDLIAIGAVAADLAEQYQDARPRRVRAAYVALRQAALAADRTGDDRASSLAHGRLGHLYEVNGRPDDAAALTSHAEFLAQRASAPDLLYRWQWQNGRLQASAGDLQGAIDSHRRAIASLRAIRQDIPVEYRDGRSSFRETLGPLFFGLADLVLRRAAQLPAGADNDALLSEARDAVELLKTAELQDYFKDECVANLQARATRIEEVAAKTAGIYPIMLADRLELLMSLPSGQRLVSVPVGREQLTEAVRQLRTYLEKRATREFLPHAQQLYDWLIRPMLPALEDAGVDTLVFVPDGALRTIPMAALFDGEHFLIERFAVASVPGLTLIDPRPIARAAPKVLLTGLSRSVQGYPGLPNVTEELRLIGDLFGGRVLQNEQFQLAALEQELRQTPYSVVHIASHGEFDSDPAKSFLLTFDGKLTMDRLEQAVKFGEYRETPLELLTLSACRTAAGDDRAALGLAGIAIKAGARSALASLWFISDAASSVLVADFYERLRDPALSKAKALQEAQRVLLQDRRFRHPGYWSAFLLIGNWL
ncbi:MAG: CHAT domain-containing protein [Proteobacteria bacterium]|nr:CHAT domain-containing protein [Pseudomonadota bacterium]